MTTLQEMLQRRRPAIERSAASTSVRRTSKDDGRVRVIISTFNRPGLLTRLLRDVMAYRPGHDISIAVYDDASTKDYGAPRALLEHMGGEYVRATSNHGKHEFWRWVSRIYEEQRKRPESIFILLPDDVRLASNFFARALEAWRRIKDQNKVALTLLRDTGREGKACWTTTVPRQVDDAIAVGWVDGAILCNRAYFEALGWRAPEVPRQRWSEDPTLSSGVGKHISHLLSDDGAGMYVVKRSLIAHVDGPSTMNHEARTQDPLRAIAFVDGEDVHSALLCAQNVTCSLASVPRRRGLLKQVVASIRPQCDQLNVYLNGYPDVPEFLRAPGIEVATSQEHGDRGDAGKFFWCDRIGGGYHLTVDDDLRYPENYVRTLIGRVERYGRKALVGVHGVVLPPTVGDTYYENRTIYHCLMGVSEDRAVHLLGTGTVAYHTDSIAIATTDFAIPNMADVWLAILAKRQCVPMVCVAHEKSWLAELDDPNPGQSIYATHKRHDGIQARHLRAAGRWGEPRSVGTASRGVRKERKPALVSTRRNDVRTDRSGVRILRGRGSPNVRKVK